MDSYDNDWVLMLDDDLFVIEEKNDVPRIQPEPDRTESGRLRSPSDSKGSGLRLGDRICQNSGKRLCDGGYALI